MIKNIPFTRTGVNVAVVKLQMIFDLFYKCFINYLYVFIYVYGEKFTMV